MLEAAGISILVKAANFLFEEGSKILQERRERQESQLGEPKVEAKPEANLSPAPAEVIQTEKELLHQRIDREAWSAREAEIQHLVSLLEIYSRNYQLAKEQYAKWGSALVPPIIVHNLEEAENAVADTMSRLRALLNAVYGKTIVIPELEKAGS
jgi:hypothetical protein